MIANPQPHTDLPAPLVDQINRLIFFTAGATVVFFTWFPVTRRLCWLILWAHHLAGGPPPPDL